VLYVRHSDHYIRVALFREPTPEPAYENYSMTAAKPTTYRIPGSAVQGIF